MTLTPRPELVGWRLLFVLWLFGAAYFFSLFFRTVNAILAPELQADLGLGPVSLGFLTAAYFLGLGLAQIPIGICLDAYGPRRVQAVLLCLAAIGIASFGIFDSVALLVLARAMIGIGLAGCLVASYQSASLWLPMRLVPFASGIFLAAGGLGALAATQPIRFLMGFWEWQQIFVALSVLVLLIALAIFVGAPDPEKGRRISWAERLRSVPIAARNTRLRRYLPLSALCFGTGTAMQGLWAAPWMTDVVGYNIDSVSWTLMAMAVALTVGSALGGAFSTLLQRVGLGVRYVVLGSAVIFIAAEIALITAQPSLNVPAWLIFSLTYNVVTLSYAYVAMSQAKGMIGISNALMNTVVILSTFAIQYGLGAVFAWTNAGQNKSPYLYTLAVLVGLQICAFWWAVRNNGRIETKA
ncbi:MAG: MFS transporter [Pseudomonadota bacterium]